MTKQKNQPEIQNHISKDNDYFLNVKAMLASSVGRLPTALVMIILISGAMAAMAGVALEFSKPSRNSKEFMPLRLEVTENSVSPDLKLIQKNWVYQTPTYAMTFTIIGDRFEWITAFADIPQAQYYGRGNYRMVGDVMVLGIRNDLGIPYDPQTPWMQYMPMAMKDINLYVSLEGTDLIWTIPTSEQRQIISQSAFIFVDNPDGVFKWATQ